MTVDDKQLVGLAKGLGASAGERVDVDRAARVVVGRLKREPEAWWRNQMPVVSGIAAAAALVVTVGILADNRFDSSVMVPFDMQAPLALEVLSPDELGEVFDSLTFDAPLSELAGAGLEDLTVGQLEELLQMMMEE